MQITTGFDIVLSDLKAVFSWVFLGSRVFFPLSRMATKKKKRCAYIYI